MNRCLVFRLCLVALAPAACGQGVIGYEQVPVEVLAGDERSPGDPGTGDPDVGVSDSDVPRSLDLQGTRDPHRRPARYGHRPERGPLGVIVDLGDHDRCLPWGGGFVAEALEVGSDGYGDDDVLCEDGEVCVASDRFGAEQDPVVPSDVCPIELEDGTRITLRVR